MLILVLNAGSSSQKSALSDLADPVPERPTAPLWEGKIEWGRAPEFRTRNARGEVATGPANAKSHREATEHLLDLLWGGPTRMISGRRRKFRWWRTVSSMAASNTFSRPSSRRQSKRASHGWRILRRSTTIRRYGFHGIKHQYCAGRAAQILGRDSNSVRLVVCHLGNGCSLAAIEGGRSVETTMGFTPLEGLVMGTRSGSVDPGILTYLMRRDHLNADDLDRMLNKKSGLLGVSGLSGDMREILAAIRPGNPRAKLAFDIYVHRLVYYIGAMAAVLGSVDALVFTAGVGENCAEARATACEKLEFMGVNLNLKKNSLPSSDQDRDIAASESRVRILIIRAQEEWAIARVCLRLMSLVRK